MPDREKVLHELDHQVADADWCDNDWKDNVPIWMLRGALALLREQEPMEPHVEHDSDNDSWYYGCGACHEAIDYKDRFCRHCGREVKWDAAD